MKRCPSCGLDKPIEEFDRNKSRYDGRQGYCKECLKTLRRTTQRKSDLKRRYGLTVEELNRLKEKHNEVCPICGKRGNEESRWGTGLVIDHCHVTGKVRGLLCSKCNAAIGLLGDSVINLENAIRYLKGSASGFR